jgi:small subunit ribosomal protein S14
MKYIVKKDKKARVDFYKREQRLIYIKALCRSQFIAERIKMKVRNEMVNLGKKFGFLTRVRNRCFITGRSGSVYGKFHLSRMKLRDLGHSGVIVGLKKSSW